MMSGYISLHPYIQSKPIKMSYSSPTARYAAVVGTIALLVSIAALVVSFMNHS